MKIIAAVIAGFLMTMPAWAEDQPPPEIVGNSMLEFGYLAQCTAMQISLAHLHMQVASSITALTDSTPQLTTLANSYKSMADAEKERVKLYTDTIKTVVTPQMTTPAIDAEIVLEKANKLIVQSLSQIAMQTANPSNSFEEQTSLERLLLQQTRSCETLANKIIQHHTS